MTAGASGKCAVCGGPEKESRHYSQHLHRSHGCPEGFRCHSFVPAPAAPSESEKDVHTDHCCIVHGCKYGDDACTVTTGRKKQSASCERGWRYEGSCKPPAARAEGEAKRCGNGPYCQHLPVDGARCGYNAPPAAASGNLNEWFTGDKDDDSEELTEWRKFGELFPNTCQMGHRLIAFDGACPMHAPKPRAGADDGSLDKEIRAILAKEGLVWESTIAALRELVKRTAASGQRHRHTGLTS